MSSAAALGVEPICRTLRRRLADARAPLAEKINAMPKYVVSSTLRAPEWNNSHVLAGDPATEVAKLKNETDAPMLVAGQTTSAQQVLGSTALNSPANRRLFDD